MAARLGGGTKQPVESRIKHIDHVLGELTRPGFSFEFHIGAAEISGGSGASYEQVLAAEMNSTKAAIMARDPNLPRTEASGVGDPRGLIYSEHEFVAFARETIAIRDGLKAKTLPWGGTEHAVVSDRGIIDKDLARALRGKKLDSTHWTSAQKATLAEFQRFVERVNTLDYIVRFEGGKVGPAGERVNTAGDLAQKLRGPGAIDARTAKEIESTLAGDHAQEGAGSEAQFFERASHLTDRVVLNADIRDLGIDVLQGNATAMEKIAAGEPIDAVSRGASDRVLDLKSRAIKAIKAYYATELIPAAERRAAELHQPLELSPSERREPIMLIGGDEITISLPRVFEQLGVVHEFVGKLQSAARARVAVTRTGTVSGAKGHADAMKASEGAHARLKETEQVARDLQDRSAVTVDHGMKKVLDSEREWFDALYTTADEQGVTVLRDKDGGIVPDLDARIARARATMDRAR